MKHIAGKLFLGFFCMAALTVGVLWLIQAGIMGDSYLNDRVEAVDAVLRQAAGAESIDYESLEESLNARFLALSQSGSILYISQGMPMRGIIVSACRSMLEDSQGTVQYLPSMSGETKYAAMGRTLQSGGTLYAIFSLSDVQAASRILRKQLWIVTAVLVVAAAALAAILSRMFSRPIRRVTGAARSLAAGNLDVHLPVGSKDEIGQLTVALNDLSDELKKTDNLRRELIANVSHELRTPLSIVQGYAETVRDVTWPYEEKRTGQLNMIIDETKRLSRIVRDILDYSRLQAGVDTLSVSDFPACEALRDLISRHEPAAREKNVSLVLDCRVGDVRFDRTKFEQVMDNLLSNAVGFGQPGTAVEVSVREKDGAARIRVANTGPVIPPEDLPRIWDRYYRAGQSGDTARTGTGLGLSIVRSILGKHQVTYGVDSRDNTTVFWFDTQPLQAKRPGL